MKNISLLCFSFLLATVATSQNAKLGLRGGLSLSTLNYGNETDVDWRTGFHAGLLAHIHATPSFSLQPEIYYSTQGAKIPFGADDINRKLSYVNIPLLLQYNFNNGFRLQGGPQVGFLLGVSEKLNGTELNLVSTDNYKTVDFSLPVGLSYLGYSGIGVDVRYNVGLSNIDDTGGPAIKNSVAQIGVFYLFDHKHKAKSR